MIKIPLSGNGNSSRIKCYFRDINSLQGPWDQIDYHILYMDLHGYMWHNSTYVCITYHQFMVFTQHPSLWWWSLGEPAAAVRSIRVPARPATGGRQRSDSYWITNACQFSIQLYMEIPVSWNIMKYHEMSDLSILQYDILRGICIWYGIELMEHIGL